MMPSSVDDLEEPELAQAAVADERLDRGDLHRERVPRRRRTSLDGGRTGPRTGPRRYAGVTSMVQTQSGLLATSNAVLPADEILDLVFRLDDDRELRPGGIEEASRTG